MITQSSQKYVIGIDGGGTKTVAVLADLKGKVWAKSKTGSSNLRNLGLKEAVANIALGIKKVLNQIKKGGKISSTFLGLPTLEEEFKYKKEIVKRELLKHREILPIFEGKVILGSDQLLGFRSGTEKKEGIVSIAGSGCVAHGWRGQKEAKVEGWGYLSEMGSAFWIGQRGIQAVWKDLDGRGPKTLITKLVFKKLKVKNKENLVEKIYSKNPIEIILSLSSLVGEAAEKKDKVAKDILIEAGKELALAVNTVVKKLNFQKVKFPLILIGSVFKSKIVLNKIKKEIKKIALKPVFIQPKLEPVMGAVKLALEELKK